MIVLRWPSSLAWAIGTLVGIELIFDGWLLVTLGSGLRQIANAAGASSAGRV